MNWGVAVVLALLIIGGYEWDRHHRVELGTAYGCGFTAARRLDWGPAQDPLDNEEHPWCVEYHKTWEKW